jgi:hypothetical protein
MHDAIPLTIGIGGLVVLDKLYVKPSTHFYWSEMTKTSTGYANDPPWQARINIVLLCMFVLERIRAHFGDRPVTVNSGYRSTQVNGTEKVNGSSTSEHMDGKAADIYISGVNMEDVATWLYETRELPIGQCIIEYSDDHLHLSIDTAHILDPANARHDYRYTWDESSYPYWKPGLNVNA